MKRDKHIFVPSSVGGTFLDQFRSSKSLPGLNAFVVGSSVFQLEQAVRQRRIRAAIIPLHHSDEIDYDFAALRELIHELIVFTLVQDIELRFQQIKAEDDYQETSAVGPRANLCLFSGGVDSYAGILIAKKTLKDVEGVFCAHADQARIIHIVDKLQRRILAPAGIEVTKAVIPPIGASGYAQLRGFLYLLTAAAFAQRLGAERIIVTECGPTMYQPTFSPLDSVTMTTHPFVVRTAKRVASLLLNREVEILLPFEDLTKAEVVAVCPAKDGLRFTHSCITQRFGTHDGTCYGCVIRRLATIAAGVKDVEYNKNPITDPSASAGNLYTLLTYCVDILTRYDKMEEFEIGMIEAYCKQDLFRRFALDNFAAIHRLISENRRVLRPIRDLYQEVVTKIGTRLLEDRISELANRRKLPDFSKIA